jgi:hypothetical protein
VHARNHSVGVGVDTAAQLDPSLTSRGAVVCRVGANPQATLKTSVTMATGVASGMATGVKTVTKGVAQGIASTLSMKSSAVLPEEQEEEAFEQKQEFSLGLLPLARLQLWKYQAKMNLMMREIEQKALLYERTVKHRTSAVADGGTSGDPFGVSASFAAEPLSPVYTAGPGRTGVSGARGVGSPPAGSDGAEPIPVGELKRSMAELRERQAAMESTLQNILAAVQHKGVGE